MFDLNLRNKIIILGVLAALVPTVTGSLLVYWKEHRVNVQMQKAIDNYSNQLIDRAADDAYSTVEISNLMIQKYVDHSLSMARALLKYGGEVHFAGPNVTWNAINQFNLKTNAVSLPRFMVGNTWIQPNPDFKVKTPVVDEATDITTATCTIFQRMNEAGDMLRIATSVPNKDGSRAISTYIPAVNPDGKPNPVIATVLSGETFRGRAFVVNNWYMTAYEPMRNGKGDIIGMLYVGIRRDAAPVMRKILAETQVGKTGFIYILYATSSGASEARDLKGECVISKDAKYDGQNLLNEQDVNGKYYIQDILQRAVKLRPNESGEMHVMLRNSATGEVTHQIIQYQYFKPWDWVIIAQAPQSDFDEARENTHRELRSLLYLSIGGGVIGLAIALWLALFISAHIARPIAQVTVIAGRIAEGNLLEAGQLAGAETCSLTKKVDDGTGSVAERFSKTRDETGRLFCAVRTMIDNLYSLISQVKSASIQLISTATQISATSKQQESTVQNFGTSTSEIAAAVKEISATSQELLKTMDDVTIVANQTGSQAASAHTSIGGMEEAMRKLAQSTGTISSKLSIINDKANNIGSVITTITKVADQTNLLSLNAAIEAEKAGEYGLGFSVVAREIRRLADQTAVATLDIEQMIREMQTSVSTGVMEMDKFSEEVRRGVDTASQLGQQFGRIIDQVQALTPRFEAVHEGMQAQSQGAQQINDAMLQLTDAARQSAVSIREFNLAAEQLHRAVQGLKEEITKFKVA
ncbi:MAG: hypothetical protein B9S32_02270 [Verrucomicrobia bacterium Tous-C9LFEB]|nr:MAG: hypothetical protein B9S32_02270 [Verrucomicrobia bacterium Tous-C9LFEB]